MLSWAGPYHKAAKRLPEAPAAPEAPEAPHRSTGRIPSTPPLGHHSRYSMSIAVEYTQQVQVITIWYQMVSDGIKWYE